MYSTSDWVTKTWFTPTFSTILQDRSESLVIFGTGVALVGLHLSGIAAWNCPFRSLFGIPCPGCGLTTATGQLLRGHFANSLRTHAFAPIFLFSFLLLTVVVFLPQKQRDSLIDWVARFERRTGATFLVLAALMVYWVVRLAGLV